MEEAPSRAPVGAFPRKNKHLPTPRGPALASSACVDSHISPQRIDLLILHAYRHRPDAVASSIDLYAASRPGLVQHFL